MASSGKKSRVAIIGGGVSGLTAIKACLEEDLMPVCFESRTEIGGLWVYTEEVWPKMKEMCVFDSVVTNATKETSCFSDFPMPQHYPPFPDRHLFLEYIQEYAKHFGLTKHVIFGTTVLEVERLPAKENFTEKWKITTQTKDTLERNEYLFDYVILASGYTRQAVFPDIPGLDEFPGIKMHSRDYRRPEMFKDKRVLVIGNCNSAGDIAVDVSGHASMAYVSLGRGTWVFSRTGPGGYPAEYRVSRFLVKTMPRWVINTMARKQIVDRMDPSNIGIYSDNGEGPLGHPVMLNDLITYCIISGRLLAKMRVIRFDGRTAIFNDRSTVDVDVVICATGYTTNFDYMKDKTIIAARMEDLELYKLVFPLKLGPSPTLGVVGCVSILGAIPPVVELQARWFTRVFTNQSRLPNSEVMNKQIQWQKQKFVKVFGRAKIRITEFAVTYTDNLAAEVGCLPQFWQLFFKHPKMALLFYFGPSLPCYYRLCGPHASWEKSQEIAFGAIENTFCGTKQKQPMCTSRSILKIFFPLLILSITLLIVILYNVNCPDESNIA